jgi:hypothetical protein
MRYKEEWIGKTRLRQKDGSQWVSVRFGNGWFNGREVRVIGQLSADRAKRIYIEAGNIAEAEDRACILIDEVNARRA